MTSIEGWQFQAEHLCPNAPDGTVSQKGIAYRTYEAGAYTVSSEDAQLHWLRPDGVAVIFCAWCGKKLPTSVYVTVE